MKLGNVRADRNFNSNFGSLFFLRVVLSQPSSDLAGFDSHNGVIARKVGRGAMKEFHPNRAFLQRLRVTLEGMLDYVGEELFRAVAVAEGTAVSDPFQLA